MKKDSMGCLIATIIIIALILIGFIFFRERLLGVSATICILLFPFLPFYYLYRKHQEEERIAAEDETEKTVEECVEELEALADDIIEEYNPEEESPTEYLAEVCAEIKDITSRLKPLQASLL